MHSSSGLARLDARKRQLAGLSLGWLDARSSGVRRSFGQCSHLDPEVASLILSATARLELAAPLQRWPAE